MINIEENKERYLYLLKEALEEDAFEAAKDWLEAGDFFTAPASTKYHLHVKGGLCQHSLNVHGCLLSNLDKWGLDQDYCKETKILVALCHDWCKINTYIPSSRRVPPERSKGGEWEVEETWIKDDEYNLGHASKSIYLLQQFTTLTMDEISSLHCHMGATDLSTMFNSFNLNSEFSKNPLAVLLHLSDMEASYMMEDGEGNKEGY